MATGRLCVLLLAKARSLVALLTRMNNSAIWFGSFVRTCYITLIEIYTLQSPVAHELSPSTKLAQCGSMFTTKARFPPGIKLCLFNCLSGYIFSKQNYLVMSRLTPLFVFKIWPPLILVAATVVLNNEIYFWLQQPTNRRNVFLPEAFYFEGFVYSVHASMTTEANKCSQDCSLLKYHRLWLSCLWLSGSTAVQCPWFFKGT